VGEEERGDVFKRLVVIWIEVKALQDTTPSVLSRLVGGWGAKEVGIGWGIDRGRGMLRTYFVCWLGACLG